MADFWYAMLALMLAAYVVFDGFDLGVGLLHPYLARNDAERRMLLRAIGPVWDGNEVWLIAAGGTLLMAMPTLLGVAFSGFYLPLMLVLWLLLLRALGIELRHQLSHSLWHQLWDAVFFVSSALLTLVFGLAIGNVVRGVSMDEGGSFFAPLWTDFGVGRQVGIIDWYTGLCAVTVVCAIALHGLQWLCLRVSGPPRERAIGLFRPVLMALVLALALTTWGTTRVQPRLLQNLGQHPVWALAPTLACAGLGATWLLRGRGDDRGAFLGSCGFLVGMMLSAAVAIYPYVLPARDPTASLTLASAVTDPHALRVALYWWLPGMALVGGYFVLSYRSLPPRLSVDDEQAH